MSLKYSSDQLIQIKCSYLIDKYKKKLKKLKDFKNELKLSYEKKNKAYYVDRYLFNKEKEELYKEFNKKKEELELESLERKKELYNSYFADIFLYEQEYYQCIYKIFKNLLLKKEELDKKEKHVIKLHEYAYMKLSDQNVNKLLEKYNHEKKDNNIEFDNKKNIDIDNLCNININEIYESIIHDELNAHMYTYNNKNNYTDISKKENYPMENFLIKDKINPYLDEYTDSPIGIYNNSYQTFEKNIEKKESMNVRNDYYENGYEDKEQGESEKEKGKEKENIFERKYSYECEQENTREKNGSEEMRETFLEDKEENNDDYKKKKENYIKENKEKKEVGNYSKTEDIKIYKKEYDENKNGNEKSDKVIYDNKEKEYLIHKEVENENDNLNFCISSYNYEYINNGKENKEILYTDENIENYTSSLYYSNLNNQKCKEIENSNLYTEKTDNNGEDEKIENEELDEVIENNIIFNISSYFSGNYEDINDNEKDDKICEEDNILNSGNFDESKIKIEYDILKENEICKNDIIRDNNMTENIELNSLNEDETANFMKKYNKNYGEYEYIKSLSENKESESTEIQKFNSYKNENSIKIEKLDTFEGYAEEAKMIDIENSNNFKCIENQIEQKINSCKTKDRKMSELKNIRELINYMSHHIKK